jgi:hypothetical protein
MIETQKEAILISFLNEKERYKKLAEYIVHLIRDDPSSPKESLHTIIYRIKNVSISKRRRFFLRSIGSISYLEFKGYTQYLSIKSENSGMNLKIKNPSSNYTIPSSKNLNDMHLRSLVLHDLSESRQQTSKRSYQSTPDSPTC